MKVRIFILLFVLSHAELTTCQSIDTYPHEFLTIEDGLPSDEVYQIIQDDNYYLWIATDNGLVKYDGNSFSVFNSNNGLPDDVVLHLFKQPNGSIYGLCKYNRFFSIQNERIVPYRYNEIVSNIITDNAKTYSFYIDDNGNTHIGTSCGYIMLSRSGEILVSEIMLATQPCFSTITLIRFPDYTLSHRSFNLDEDSCRQIIWKENKTKRVLFDGSKLSDSPEFNYLEIIDNNDVALINLARVFILDAVGVKQILTFQWPPVSVTWIDSSLWVGTIGHGVFEYRKSGDSLLFRDHFLDGATVTSVMKDHQGGYWFTTRERGIVHVSNFELTIYFEATNKNYISAFFKDEDFSVVAFDNGFVVNTNDSTRNFNAGSKINSISRSDDDNFLFFRNGVVMDYSYNLHLLVPDRIYSGTFDLSAYSAERLNERFMVFYSLYYFTVYDCVTEKIVHRSDKYDTKSVMTDHATIDEKIVIGGSRGISFFDAGDFHLIDRIPLPSPVVSICESGNFIAVACKNGNIYFSSKAHPEKLSLMRITNQTITDAAVYKNQFIIVSNLGIKKYLIDKTYGVWNCIKSIGISGVKKIEIFNDKIYYLTKKEIFEDQDELSNTIPPVTTIETITADKITIPKNQSCMLDYDQNDIFFRMNAISFSQPVQSFKFQLIGLDREPRFTSDNVISYSSLDPGDYLFEASSTSNGLDFSDKVTFQFTIKPPFWLTGWFISASVLLVLTAISLTFFSRLKKIKTKLAFQKTIEELKSKALAAQLNPHLVFNVLNSIQGIISRGEIEKANRYVSRFSKFMRQSLLLSKKTKITLAEELDITQNYVDLELIRYPTELSFSISNQVHKSNYFVPPLVIQPFIENAIKHGIMPSKNKVGNIHIDVTEKNHTLYISIEDDGIGFLSPPDFTKGDGMRISKERLEIQHPENSVYLDSTSSRTRIILKIQ